MESKKDIDLLIKNVKQATGLTQEGIAKRIGYSREYLSQAKKTNSEGLYEMLEKTFRAELTALSKPGKPGSKENREKALIKMLYQRIAKIESERLGIPVEKVMEEMDRDTMLAWMDLEKS